MEARRAAAPPPAVPAAPALTRRNWPRFSPPLTKAMAPPSAPSAPAVHPGELGDPGSQRISPGPARLKPNECRAPPAQHVRVAFKAPVSCPCYRGRHEPSAQTSPSECGWRLLCYFVAEDADVHGVNTVLRCNECGVVVGTISTGILNDLVTLTLATEMDRFIPDADHINALPGPLRQYIHDLETRADPAGDVARSRY